MNEVYALFLIYDMYLSTSETLLGVFETEELALQAYYEKIGYMVKRYNTLRCKNNLTKKEQIEFEKLCSYNLKYGLSDMQYSIKKFKLNEIIDIIK